jgi:hypothetical protein
LRARRPIKTAFGFSRRPGLGPRRRKNPSAVLYDQRLSDVGHRFRHDHAGPALPTPTKKATIESPSMRHGAEKDFNRRFFELAYPSKKRSLRTSADWLLPRNGPVAPLILARCHGFVNDYEEVS